MKLYPSHWLYEHIARGNCNGCQWCDRVPNVEKTAIRAAGPSLIPGDAPIIITGGAGRPS